MGNELKDFLRNTEKALRNNTVEELNRAVVNFLKNKDKDCKQGQINKVLQIVCSHYNISRRVLIEGPVRADLKNPRYLCYVILHTELQLPIRFIAARVFKKWHNSIGVAINYFRKLDPKIKTDKEFLEIYEKLKVQLKTEQC